MNPFLAKARAATSPQEREAWMRRYQVQRLRQDVSACERCTLRQTCDAPLAPHYPVRIPAPLAIIVANPKARQLLSNRARILLSDALVKQAGVSLAQCAIIPAVACQPPDYGEPSEVQLLSCQPLLERALKLSGAKAALLLGGVAFRSIFPDVYLSHVRGYPMEKDGIHYLATYSPDYILRKDDQEAIFSWHEDLWALGRILHTPFVQEALSIFRSDPTNLDWPQIIYPLVDDLPEPLQQYSRARFIARVASEAEAALAEQQRRAVQAQVSAFFNDPALCIHCHRNPTNNNPFLCDECAAKEWAPVIIKKGSKKK